MAKIRIKVERVETYDIVLTTGETYTIESSGTGARGITGRVIGRDGRDLLVRNGKKITAIPMARIKSASIRGVLSPHVSIPVPATNGTQKATRKKAVRRATRKAMNRRAARV